MTPAAPDVATPAGITDPGYHRAAPCKIQGLFQYFESRPLISGVWIR